MKYGLHDRPPFAITVVTALQWLIVTLSSSIVVPLMIGQVYGLNAAETSQFMQQTIFFVGLASLLQVWIGHRYPMMEAPAGLWWGIFIILAQIGISIGTQPRVIGQSFQLGLILAGAMFVIFGMVGWIGRIQKWFTPSITGIYMTLLSVSLSSNFIKGMLGLGYKQATLVQPAIAIMSVVIMALVILFLRMKAISSFAVLLGIIIGWISYAVLGWSEPIAPTTETIVWPTLFFWGPPHWDVGVIVTSLLTAFVLLTNLITSIEVVGRTVDEQATASTFNRGGIFNGISHILSGASGVVGMISLSLAAAVIKTTNMAARLPFMLAMIAMMLIGIFPGITHFLSSIPTPVAYAAMFVTYTQLLGFGLKDFARSKLEERDIIVIGSSLLIGIGVMFIPTEAWKHLNPMLSYLFGNGLLLGVLVALLMEHVILPERKRNKEQRSS